VVNKSQFRSITVDIIMILDFHLGIIFGVILIVVILRARLAMSKPQYIIGEVYAFLTLRGGACRRSGIKASVHILQPQ
jgi:hypothetical protein